MKYLIKYSPKKRSMVAGFLLALFLFSNYIVNYTGLHHHHYTEEQASKDSGSHLKKMASGDHDETSCLFCHFQTASYTPMSSPPPDVLQKIEEQEHRLQTVFVFFHNTGVWKNFSERGPPSFS